MFLADTDLKIVFTWLLLVEEFAPEDAAISECMLCSWSSFVIERSYIQRELIIAWGVNAER